MSVLGSNPLQFTCNSLFSSLVSVVYVHMMKDRTAAGRAENCPLLRDYRMPEESRNWISVSVPDTSYIKETKQKE
jgi:hypothetical protein